MEKMRIPAKDDFVFSVQRSSYLWRMNAFICIQFAAWFAAVGLYFSVNIIVIGVYKEKLESLHVR